METGPNLPLRQLKAIGVYGTVVFILLFEFVVRNEIAGCSLYLQYY